MSTTQELPDASESPGGSAEQAAAEQAAAEQAAAEQAAADAVEPTPPAQPLPRLLPYAVAAVAIALFLDSVDGLVARVQVQDGSAGGIEALGAWPWSQIGDRATALLTTWHENRQTERFVRRCFGAYTAVDTLLFPVVYVVLLHRLLLRARVHAGQEPSTPDNLLQRAARRTWWAPTAVAGFDVAENIARAALLFSFERGGQAGWLATLTTVFTTLKLAALVAFGLMLAVLLREAWHQGLIRVWADLLVRSVWRLRVACTASAALCALLTLDATEQVRDLVRAWLDDATSGIAAVVTLGCTLLLSAALWVSARRVALADNTPSVSLGAVASSSTEEPRARWWIWLGVALVASVVAYITGWRQLWGLVVILTVVGLAGVLWKVPSLSEQRGQLANIARNSRQAHADAPSPARTLALHKAARAAAVAPPTALALVAVSALSPVPLVLADTQRDDAWVLVTAVLTVVSAAGAVLLAVFGTKVLRAWDVTPARRNEVRYRVVAASVALVTAAALALALAVHSALVTATTVVVLALAVLVLILGEAQRWSEMHEPPPGLAVLGFTRTPFVVLLAVWAGVTSMVFENGSSHSVHRQGDLPPSLLAHDRAGVDLKTAFNEWLAAGCGQPGEKVPLVLAAGNGGGLRAAYWTAAALTRVAGDGRAPVAPQQPDCATSRADRVFALGGASGGSLGAVSWSTRLDDDAAQQEDWYVEALGRADFLTDPLAWFAFVDAPRALLGFPGEDRARRLEERWIAHNEGLADGFFDGTWGLGGRRPLTLLTGTQVESGCRLNVGGVRLAPTTGSVTSCTTTSASVQPTAPLTSDVLDYLCGGDGDGLQRASAALLSARFPYVSPSGQFEHCEGGTSAVVDGGYAENTGAQHLLELWSRLEPLVAAHNQRAGATVVVPVFLQLDNHYASSATPPIPRRTAELLVPPDTRSRPDGLDDRGLEQLTAATFGGDLPGRAGERCDLAAGVGRFVLLRPQVSPGLTAPLAWSMSRMATDDLDAQLDRAMKQPAVVALDGWLAGSGAPC